jgi:hypothetical protein
MIRISGEKTKQLSFEIEVADAQIRESATRVIDGAKLVGTQTIAFLLCRLPSYCSGSEPEERDNAITFPCCGIGPRSSMRVKRH